MKSNKLKTSIDSFQKILTEQIGMELSHLRKEKGLSGSDLAKKLKISQQQISRYENGVNNISFDKLIILFNALEMSCRDIDVFFEKMKYLFDSSVYKNSKIE